jgi:outer membrane biosynthesis protein TonB
MSAHKGMKKEEISALWEEFKQGTYTVSVSGKRLFQKSVEEAERPPEQIEALTNQAVEEIQPPEPPVEEIQPPEPPVEEIQPPEPPVEEIQPPEPPVEEIQPPEPPVEEIQPVEAIPEPTMQNEKSNIKGSDLIGSGII